MSKTPTKDFNKAAVPDPSEVKKRAPAPVKDFKNAAVPDPSEVKKRAPAPQHNLPQPGLGNRQMQNQMVMDAAAAKRNAAEAGKSKAASEVAATKGTPQLNKDFNKSVKGPGYGRGV